MWIKKIAKNLNEINFVADLLNLEQTQIPTILFQVELWW